jgi:hypothetical protein
MKAKRKINSTQYNALVPAIAAYRNNLKEFAGIVSGKNYGQIYTEPRVYGARSKFWSSNFSRSNVKKVVEYIKEHPVCYVFAGKRRFEEYTVSLVEGSVYNRLNSRRRRDYQLVFSIK